MGSSDSGAFTVKAGTNGVDEAGNALAAVYTHAATLTLDTTAPAAPVSLAAEAGDAKATLTWGDPSPADATISKWQYRQKATGSYGEWQDVTGGASARSVEVGSLSNGTAYTFQVRAVDTAANEGAAGTTDEVTPAAATTPTPSGGIWSATLTVDHSSIYAGCGTDGSLDDCATMTVLSDDDFMYGEPEQTFTITNLFRTGSSVATRGTGSLEFRFSGLTGAQAKTALSALTLTVAKGGASTTLKVSEATASGNYLRWDPFSGASWGDGDTVSLSLNAPAATKPAKPTGLTATAGDKQVALFWTDPSDSGITKYQVQQKAGSAAWGSWTDIPSSGATTTSYTVTGLTNGTEYRFRIRAVNAAGNSPQSAVAGPATPASSDTTAPTVTSAETGFYGEAGATTALTGPLRSGADIYTKVTFSEDMKHVKSDAAAARPELFRRIGTTDTRYHVLDSGDTLASGDCKPEDSTSTDVYVCRYTVGSSDSGAFTVKAGTNSVDEAGNALAAAYTHAATLALDTTAPAAPSGLALASGTTSPGSDATPSIEVTVGETGGAVTLYSDAACTTAASAATDVTDAETPFKVTVDATAIASDGSVTFYATHADAAGNASACSTASVAYVHDGTDPGIAFPDGVTPTAGTAATIALTDATSKVAKYGAIPVVGTSTDATGCDTAAEVGTGNLTTLATPSASVDFEYTPPADSAGKKVCAYAEDAAGNSHAALWSTAIAAANVAPAFSSDAAFSVAENQTAVGTVSAADANAGDSVTYAITGGTDQAKFAIVAGTGVLTFAAAPDFEDPQDAASTTPSNAAANNEYVLVVTATGGTGARAMTAAQTIVVTVTNVDEDGSVTFGSTAPRVGEALTASVEDPDGGVSSVTWQWAKATTKGGTYADISGATSASYTPAADDEDAWLRATAGYTDAEGTGKSAAAVAAAAVAAATTTTPTPSGGIWSATLTVQVSSANAGCFDSGATACSTGLTQDKFTHGGTEYTIVRIELFSGGSLTLETNKTGARTALSALTLTVGSGATAKTFRVSDTVNLTSDKGFYWTDSQGLSWSSGDTVSLQLNAPAATKPAKPTGLTATAGDEQVALSWTDPSDSSITKYQVRQKAGSAAWGSWTDIPSSGATTTSYTVTGLTNGTAYRFRIRAVNAAGNSPQSDVVGPATPKADGASFTAPASGWFKNGDTVSFTIVATPGSFALNKALRVDIFRRANADCTGSGTGYGSNTSAGTPTTATQQTFNVDVTINPVSSAVSASTNFCVRIAEPTTVLWKQEVPLTNFRVDFTDPGIAWPTSWAPKTGVSGTIVLTDSNAKIAKYGAIPVVGTSTDATGCDTAAEIGSGNLTTLSTPSASVNFAYTPPADSATKKVCAYAEDVAGNSHAALYGTAIAQGAPAQPTGLRATAGDAQVTLSWTDPADSTITKYQLAYKKKSASGDASFADITGSGATTTSHTVTGLDNGDVYQFWLRAVNSGGNGTHAGPVEATPASSDTTAPTVTSGSTGYYGEAGATTALTGPLKSGADIYTKVTFSEDMKHVKSDAAAARPELFHRIGSSDTQYHILDSGDTLASGDCKPEDSTSTDVYVCFYTVGSSDSGAFTVKAGTNSVDEAGNALASAYTHAATLTLDTTAPAAPVSLAAEAGDAKVTLTWSDPSPADATISKWQYRQKTTGSYGEWQDVTGGASARSVEVGSLNNGTAYTFQVRAVDTAANEGAAGTTDEVTPAASDTTAPTVTSAETGYYAEAGATTTLTGPLKSGADIYTKVTFSENMKHVKSDAAAARPELFHRIGTTDTQYHILDSGDTLASGDCRPEDSTSTDVYVCLYTVGSSDSGAFTVKAGTNSVDKAGNALASVYTHAATLTLDTTGPSIAAIAVSSSPDANTGSQYAIGKTIAVTATFDEAIVLTGAPTLKIKVGTAEKSASCARKGATGDDAKKLVCSYTVAEGDLDADGIAVEAGKLAGTIKDAADNAATLTYTAIAAQSGHKVDGVKPTISRIVFNSTAAIWTAGTAPTIWVVFSESVDVTGAPTLAAKIGSATRTYTYSSVGSGGGDLNFSYTLQAGDEDSDGVSVDAGSLTLPSDASIKDGAGNDATVTHSGMAAQAGFKVDAVKPAIEFPGTGPRVGAASRIVLTDTTAKVKKHGAIVVDAAATDATGCDAASEIGSNLTTLDTAASPVNLDFTPPSDSLGKKVCAYAEDAAGNSHAALWSTAIAAATTTTPSGGIWSATLTVDHASLYAGCGGHSSQDDCATETVLSDDDFMYGEPAQTFTITGLHRSTTGTLGTGALAFQFSGLTGAQAKTALSALTLTVAKGGSSTTLKVSEATTSGNFLQWSTFSGARWGDGDTVSLSLAGPNSAATGKPSIAGTATVGQTLTAAKGTVADTNGVTKADNGDAGFAYTYQWIRVDGDGSSNAADIPGATSSTYVLKAADRGKKVKVKLSFQDDAGNAESRTGDAYPASGTVAAATTTPTAVWDATLTVGHASGVAGCGRSGLPGCATPTVLSQNSFIHGGKTYTIAKLYRYAVGDAGAGRLILEFSGLTGAQAKAALSGLTLTVTGGGTDTVLKVSEATAEGNELKWYAFSGARWGDGDTVTLSLAGTATTPAVPPSGANKLVGNVRQAPGPLTVPFKWDAAQKFTTGRHPGGYRLTHVDIAVRDGSSSTPDYKVTIHAPRSTDQNSRKGNLPGEVLATLTNPKNLPTTDNEVASFTVPGGSIELAPRSHYFVVIDVTGPGDRRVKVRTVAAVGGRYVYSAATAPQAPLDRDSVANWSIGDVAWRRPAGSTGSWTKRIPRPACRWRSTARRRRRRSRCRRWCRRGRSGRPR